MTFNLFVIPFLLGLIFVLYKITTLFYTWLKQIDKKDKQKFRYGVFKPRFWSATWEVFTESLLHKSMFKKNPLLGYMHLTFAFGWFLLIVFGNLESRIYSGTHINPPYYPIFLKYFIQDQRILPFELSYVPGFFRFTMDFLLLFILSGLVLAIVKRSYSTLFGMKRTSKHNMFDRIAIASLWMIFVSRLFAEGVTAGIYHEGSFLTNNLGKLLATFLPLRTLLLPVWWLYSINLGIFFFTLPWSRFMHIPTEIALIYLRHFNIKIKEEVNGIVNFEAYACPKCGVCIDACQMNIVNKHKSTPAYFIKMFREKKMDENVVNNCLLCGRCHFNCPVKIDTIGLRTVARSIENRKIDYDFDYLQNYELHNNNRVDILYFAGCMGHLTPSVKNSMIKIFNSAGIRYKFIDKDGSICCGRPLYMAGMFDAAFDLIEKNKKIILDANAKSLVTSCPICYKFFKEKYELKNIDILHHSVFINKLITFKMINAAKSNIKAVFHDPCELGRGSNIYNEPRETINQIAYLIEPEQVNENAFCCGGSLGDFNMSMNERNKITAKTLDVLTDHNPDIIVTACPLCKKTLVANANINVVDIAEIVAEMLI